VGDASRWLTKERGKGSSTILVIAAVDVDLDAAPGDL
jgi:hypothetical protein